MKIAYIQYGGYGSPATITPEGDPFVQIEVSSAYVEKHHPEIGGYFIVYEGGYQSFSPAKAFEDGYALIA